jgi:hypothetical protein
MFTRKKIYMKNQLCPWNNRTCRVKYILINTYHKHLKGPAQWTIQPNSLVSGLILDQKYFFLIFIVLPNTNIRGPHCHVDHCTLTWQLVQSKLWCHTSANKIYLTFIFILNKLWNYDESWNATQYRHIHDTKWSSFTHMTIPCHHKISSQICGCSKLWRF